MKFIKSNNFLLILILILGIVVRLWGINFGLPYIQHLDEGSEIYTAFYAAANHLKPDMYFHTTFLPYTLIFLYGIYYLLGLVFHLWGSTQQFFTAFLKDPSIFVLIGRIITVIVSVASIVIIYWIGKKLYTHKVGLISALFLSFAFLHVQESHYIKEDVMMGFFGLLIYFNSYQLSQKGRLIDYLLCGLFLGMSSALKYNFFIFLPVFVASHLLFCFQSKHKWLYSNIKFLTAIFIVVTLFFLINPYILIDWSRAVQQLDYQRKLSVVQWVSSEGQPVWVYYIVHHLLNGIGSPLLTLSVLGIFYSIFCIRSTKDTLLVITPICFFLTIGIIGGTNFSRYLVMIIPQLMLIAAITINRLINMINRTQSQKNLLLFLVSVLIIAPSAILIVNFDYYLSSKDTRILAKNWIEQNISPGTKLVNEGAARSQFYSTIGPPLLMDRKSLDKLITEVFEKGLDTKSLFALSDATKGKVGYNLIGAPRVDYRYNSDLGSYSILPSVDEYARGKYCFLILSSWAIKNGQKYNRDFETSIEDSYYLYKEFLSYPELNEDPIWNVDYSNLTQVRLFDKKVTSGPRIKIFKLKGNEAPRPASRDAVSSPFFGGAESTEAESDSAKADKGCQ